MIDTLIARRDIIGHAYLARSLALDRFRFDNGRILFDDLAVKHGLREPAVYVYKWFDFDNSSGRRTPLSGAESSALPSRGGEYLALEIVAPGDTRTVTVYLRRREGGSKIVGIQRASD